MATLQQIYANLFVGAFVGSGSLGLFGLAIRYGYNNGVAPRSWSRPKAIIKNVLKAPYAFTWMCWSMKLTYPELLAGIPGTGTRENGWAGPLLKVNLDGIIMLKYEVLLMKVALFASLLCMIVILPLNLTAKCDPDVLGADTCAPLTNLTDFEVTTIANIPPLIYNATGTTQARTLENFWYVSLSPRYLAIALVSLAIYWYICHLVWKEWIENLALRRIYYLEHDHFEERREELNGLVELDVPEDAFQKTRPPWLPHPELRETVPNISLYSCLYQLPNKITTDKLANSASDLERQQAATVDFFDQCVPNQPGFSSSVVAVTILPEPAQVAQAWKKWFYCGKKLRQLRYIRYHIQRQLELQEAREEEWVVEEAADTPQETKNAGSLSEKNEVVQGSADIDSRMDVPIADIQTSEEVVEAVDVESGEPTGENSPRDEEQHLVKDEEAPATDTTNKEAHDNAGSFFGKVVGQVFGGSAKKQASEQETKEEMAVEKDATSSPPHTSTKDSAQDSTFRDTGLSAAKSFKYSRFNVNEAAKKIGLAEETVLTGNFAGDNIGIEQLSVYAREYAQSSSGSCPFGFAEELIRYSTLERLQELEKEALEKVNAAYADLVDARDMVNHIASGVPAEEAIDEGAYDPTLSKKNDGPDIIEEGDNQAREPSSGVSSIRRRAVSSSIKKWHQAQAVVGSINRSHKLKADRSSLLGGCMNYFSKESREVVQETTEVVQETTDVVDVAAVPKLKKVVNILAHPTFAVVTLTSRQAAVAARQCLADGGGLDRWIEIEELPVAPLADAPPCDIMDCRSCCRPVTLTISEREKKMRRFLGLTIMFFFCFFYTIPLALTSQMLNPAKLHQAFPDSKALDNPDSFFFRLMAGISSGLMYTLFFSFCPQLFKAIANFEGNVSSKRTAEDKALKYFWIFMMTTSFTGTMLAQMLAEVFIDNESLGEGLKQVVVGVANSIPTVQAPVWMNWLIVKFTYTLPFLYMFQANTFGFNIAQWPWCGRLMRGGGPGGPPPYRIYVDGGTALMCIVAIAPACPLIAPLALAYYAVMLLMLRWLLLFVYRPWYDAGGNKWPALHEIIISATIFGQVLMCAMLLLRQAVLPGVMVGLSIVPTLLFSRSCKDNFLRAYNDSSLLQTSRLDGWDSEMSRTREDREEFRQWLADSHKASYVPICLASKESPWTVEPAVVTATRRDKADRMRGPLMGASQRGARFARFGEEGPE